MPLLSAVLSLSACAVNTAATAIEVFVSVEASMTTDVSLKVPNVDLSERIAETDLTALSAQMAYVQLSDMMLRPEDYEGKTVKLRGTFAHAEEDGKDFYVCYITDATACCSQSLEFETDQTFSFPSGYPDEFSDITVYGIFDTYDYNGYTMYRLIHAELSY